MPATVYYVYTSDASPTLSVDDGSDIEPFWWAFDCRVTGVTRWAFGPLGSFNRRIPNISKPEAGRFDRCALDRTYPHDCADEARATCSDFRCVKCESEANVDYNAAKNIGTRYVRRGQQSSRRRGNSQLALKSGTVTPSGGFTAHPDGFETEFTDKPHPQRANPSR